MSLLVFWFAKVWTNMLFLHWHRE